MNLFKLQKKRNIKKLKQTAFKKPTSESEALLDVHKEPTDIILNPRITEKATDKNQDNIYVFEINPNSNKKMISQAFYQIYKVKPLKINVARNPSKNIFARGKKGVKNGVKKAYIYLKEGDKIDVI